jgi:hypothetical protein
VLGLGQKQIRTLNPNLLYPTSSEHPVAAAEREEPDPIVCSSVTRTMLPVPQREFPEPHRTHKMHQLGGATGRASPSGLDATSGSTSSSGLPSLGMAKAPELRHFPHMMTHAEEAAFDARPARRLRRASPQRYERKPGELPCT